MQLQVCRVRRGHHGSPFLRGRPEVTSLSKARLVRDPSQESPLGTAKAEGGSTSDCTAEARQPW